MPKFRFAFQRVLEYRRMQESWSKDAFLEMKRCRLAAELVAEKILQERDKAMLRLPRNIEEMKTLDFYFERLQCEYENQQSVISLLLEDEAHAHEEWIEARKRLKAMERLHDMALSEYLKAEAKKDQKQLDEWTNSRRAA